MKKTMSLDRLILGYSLQHSFLEGKHEVITSRPPYSGYVRVAPVTRDWR